MKLKNLMYATMFACAFASCSNDDVPEIPTPGTDGDATLSLKVSAPLSTKSITGTDSDEKITRLTTYVFDTQATRLEAFGTTTDSETVVQTAGLKAGTKKVIVLANIQPTVTTGLLNGTLYSDFIAMSSANLAKETNGNLSMNSRVYDVVLKAGVINYLGYATVPTGDATGNIVLGTNNAEVATAPVKLFRNVAKVVLKSITFDPKNNERYPNASLLIENVYILNGRSTTNIVGEGAATWGTTMSATSAYENGMSKTAYEEWVATFKATTKDALYSYLTNNYETSAFAAYGQNLNVTLDKDNLVNPAAGVVVPVDQFYVYENTLTKMTKKEGDDTNANTLLVVKGKFKYDGLGDDITKIESRYYTVAIGHATGLQFPEGFNKDGEYYAASGRANLEGVLRNLQYNVELTVTGPGYTTPVGPKPEDDTFLQTQVEVVPFGQVTQTEEIE